jgi:hypothetical protein
MMDKLFGFDFSKLYCGVLASISTLMLFSLNPAANSATNIPVETLSGGIVREWNSIFFIL